MAEPTKHPSQATSSGPAAPEFPAASGIPAAPAAQIESPAAPASQATPRVPGAPVPPASCGSAPGQPVGPSRPTVPGAPVAPDARSSEEGAPRSALETARAAVENIPGLSDINMSQLDAIEPGPHRASPLSFIPTSFKIIPSFFAIIVVWAFQLPKLFENPEGAPMFLLISVLVFVALLALVVVVAVVSWRIHTWELEDDALVLRTKFITSSEKRIPYQRVHSIDLNAGLFSRLLGLVDVSVGTGAAVAEKIDGLKRSDAEVLKRAVFARRELLSKVAAAEKAAAAQGASSGKGATASVSAALAAARAAGEALRADVPAYLDAASSTGQPAGLAGSSSAAQNASQQPAGLAGAFAVGGASDASAPSAYDDVLAPDRVDHETRLTRRQYVLGALTSPNINGLIVSLAGFVAGLIGLLDFAADIVGEQVVYGLLGTGAEITAESAATALSGMGAGLVGAIVGVLLVVVLVVWVASAALSLIKWGNFVARRRGDRVEVSWGLLSRSTRAVELGRVQYVSVEQSLIRRVTGYARVVAHMVSVNAGEDASSLEAGVVVHPFIKLSEVDAWLADMLPEFSGVASAAPGLDRLPPQALRRTLLHGLYWALACAVLAAVPMILRATGVFAVGGGAAWFVDVGITALWALTAFVLVWGEFIRVLAWRHRRVGIEGRLFVMRDGALGTTISASSRTKIQALLVSQSPFQRGARVASVRVNTAGAGGDLRMRDAGTGTTETLLDWARPHYHNEAQVAQALADAGLA